MDDIQIDRHENEEPDQRVYTTFRHTYKIIPFIMGVGMIYPNPKLEKRRLTCMFVILLSVVPISVLILRDMFYSFKRRDIINIIRHSTVVGPFLGGFFKMFLMFYKKRPAEALINEMDQDYHTYNSLPRDYKKIIDKSIENNLFYSETCWAITVVSCVMTFPLMAVIQTTYNALFKSIPTKYMVHDLTLPYMEDEDRFKSPVFEIVFAYMLYASLMYVINFIGYDGFFGLSINHACLKMELYCKAFEDALKEKSERAMHAKIVNVIYDQNRLSRYVELIQDTFNIWLGIILIATMIQIGTCMYHITEGYELDLRYIIFITGTVIHIYLPCRYSAKLKHMSVETSTLMYCGGWERVPSKNIRMMVQFMIARGQIPFEITAFNLLIFDMDLFVSILNSSYSMYTLLRS